MKSLYDIVGVAPDATFKQIKRAYIKRAKELHPDATGKTDDEEFKELNRAYQVLSDPKRREHYDLTGDTDGGEKWNEQISQVIAAIMLEGIEQLAPDITYYVKKKVHSGKGMVKEQLEQLHKDRANLEKGRARLFRIDRNPDDFVFKLLDSKIAEYEDQIASQDERIKMADAVLAKIEEFGCKELPKDDFENAARDFKTYEGQW